MKKELLPESIIDDSIPLENGNQQTINHVFDQHSVAAINTALAIGRPLLVYGEPGIGKSQLAQAAAAQLKRVYIPFVCDAHTESRDLLWTFDAVARLAEAQIQGSIPVEERKADTLAVKNFVQAQALWWALNWESAKEHGTKPAYQAPCSPENGTVILIDEIDKTDSDVPNGLLEVLGSKRFQPQGLEPVEADPKAKPPLIIVTSNNERQLPDAFIRRCVVLHLTFPADQEQNEKKRQQQQVDFLVSRGLEQTDFKELGETVIQQAAEMLVEDRQTAKENHLYPLCGQAEFFDLLRGVKELTALQGKSPADLMNTLRLYVYRKHEHFPNREGNDA